MRAHAVISLSCFLLISLLHAASSSEAAGSQVLPQPDGEYAVGMRRFELIDLARERRVLPGYVWYPAKSGNGKGRPYLTSSETAVQGPSMARNFEYASDELDHLDRVVAQSTEGAPPARGAFPVLVFSHGYRCYPAQNTALLERLASHGYIVLSIAHPQDSVDLKFADGTLVKTTQAERDPQFAALRRTFANGTTHDERTSALVHYAQALSRDRLGSSLATWRDDTIFAARSIVKREVPAPLRQILERGDVQRLGFIGMSFGGATAASSCRLVDECRAAVNLDGGNYDPAMFNASVERPLLLMMSDWVNLPLPGRTVDPTFNPNDYAYEPWRDAGLDRDVVRLRLAGIRHMGYTDLILLMGGASHEARFGTIAPRVAVDTIGDAVLAFLDEYLKGRGRGALNELLQTSAVLHAHSPESVREWARTTGR